MKLANSLIFSVFLYGVGVWPKTISYAEKQDGKHLFDRNLFVVFDRSRLYNNFGEDTLEFTEY